jgi:hypothetical protein
MKRKGYYFSVEATLGILVLATAFLMIVYFTESSVPIPDYRYARNIAGYMSSVTLGEICELDGCVGYSIAGLGLENHTLIDIIGAQYSLSPENATNITTQIFTKADLGLRGKEVSLIMRGIGCDVIFTTGNLTESSCEQDVNETTMVVYRKVINGYNVDVETGDLNFWGDYLFEVRVWS